MQDDPHRSGNESEWQVHWGHLLRTARQVAGLSLSELSAATGLSKGYLSKLESGHVTALNPSRATLAALARALPSFQPMAQTLEPTTHLGTLAFREVIPQVPEIVLDPTGTPQESPVHLGWRELEAVVALLTLEQSAVAQPITVVVLARAVRRPAAALEPVLDNLVRMGVFERRAPNRFGGAPTYQRAVDFAARVGISRLGDALVLAAALLQQATGTRKTNVPSRQRMDWEAGVADE